MIVPILVLSHNFFIGGLITYANILTIGAIEKAGVAVGMLGSTVSFAMGTVTALMAWKVGLAFGLLGYSFQGWALYKMG